MTKKYLGTKCHFVKKKLFNPKHFLFETIFWPRFLSKTQPNFNLVGFDKIITVQKTFNLNLEYLSTKNFVDKNIVVKNFDGKILSWAILLLNQNFYEYIFGQELFDKFLLFIILFTNLFWERLNIGSLYGQNAPRRESPYG